MPPADRKALVERLERIVNLHNEHCELLDLAEDVLDLLRADEAERDKWLDAFNRSEQFQSGPLTRAEQAEARERVLLEALAAILREPFGCPWCDSGKLRPGCTEHGSDCGFALALAATREEPSDA
jgi:hypothetical protein